MDQGGATFVDMVFSFPFGVQLQHRCALAADENVVRAGEGEPLDIEAFLKQENERHGRS